MKHIARREKIFIICLVLFLHLLIIYLLAHLKSHYDAVPCNWHDPADYSADDVQKNDSDERWVSHSGNGIPISFAPGDDESQEQEAIDVENSSDATEKEEQQDLPDGQEAAEQITAHVTEQPITSIAFADSCNTNIDRPKTDTPVRTEKKLPTLAQLAQGFTKHMQQNVSSGQGFHTTSYYSGRISGKQIVCEQYENKIVRAICNTFRIHRDRIPQSAQKQSAGVRFAVNRDGKVAGLCMLISTGNIQIDSFVLSMIQQASSAFPRLPAAIEKDMYEFPVIRFDSVYDFLSEPGAWRRTSG